MSKMGVIGFYINLDRAVKRREHIEEQARRYGLSLIRISGVDGGKLPADQLLAYQPATSPKRRLTAGEIGCFLSHRTAWQRIVDGDTTYGAVFEDDVLLSPEAGRFLSDDHWLPPTVDLVKTETFMRKVALASVVSRTPDNRKLARLNYTHYGTGGYIVSRNCAARLLEATQVFHDPVDIAMFSPKCVVVRNLNILQLTPAICIQQMRAPQTSEQLGLEGSSLFQARAVANCSAESQPRSALKSVGQSIENLVRESRERVRAWRVGGNWGMVEFR
jgi:glycosyl transferase family 25